MNITNTMTINLDGTFDYTPTFDPNPLINLAGCPAEFVGTFELFPPAESGPTYENFIVTDFDINTGRIQGYITLPFVTESGASFGYGVNTCNSVPANADAFINYTVSPIKCFYSQNPIEINLDTESAFSTVEVEIFGEMDRGTEQFFSLGTFTFKADSEGFLKQNFSTIVNTWLEDRIRGFVPNLNGAVAALPRLSAAFKYQYRIKISTWSDWTASEPFVAIYGGRSFEDVSSLTIELHSMLLATGEKVLQPQQLTPMGYCLLEEIGQYTINVDSYDENGSSIAFYSQIINNTVRFSVHQFASSISGSFGSVALLDSNSNILAEVDQLKDNEQIDSPKTFVYLSQSGSFGNLTCKGSITSSIEVKQDLSESASPYQYYTQSDVAYLRAYRTTGVKRHKVSTGFFPQPILKQVMQDLLLSTKVFIVDNQLEKLIPVIINSKGFEYFTDKRTDLRSFSFEFRYAFDTNQFSNR